MAMLMANGLSELIRLPDVLRLSLYLSALLPLSHSFLDELTSARCQAKCLSDFEAESLVIN